MMSVEAKNNNNSNNDDDTGKSPDPAAEDANLVSLSLANASSSKSSDDGIVVSLVSGDGRHFELPLKAAKDSGMVREALNLNADGELEDDEEEDNQQDVKKKVDCIRVQSDVLEKIVAFLKHNQTERMKPIPMQLPTPAVFEDCVPQEWYRQLVTGMNPQDLFFLVSAANYMNIVPLFDLASFRVTLECQGKNREEIHQYLGIPQLTFEDEEQARKDHPWIFDETEANKD